MSAELRRIQFVISGPFLLLLLLAAGSMTAGFYLYTHQPPPPKPRYPSYYVNRASTAVRPCYQCVAVDGKLKASTEWKLAKATEISPGEQWWFSPVTDPPDPVSVDGVPMLALHPARDNQKPWEGFDERRVVMVVFQDLDPKFVIEHPTPPPPQADVAPNPAPDAATPAQPTQ